MLGKTCKSDLIAVLTALIAFVLVLGLGFGLRRSPEEIPEAKRFEVQTAETTAKDSIILTTILEVTATPYLNNTKRTQSLPTDPFIVASKNVEIGGNKSSLDKANEILSKYPIIDGHNDLPWLLRTNYDNKLADYQFDNPELETTTLQKLRKGHLGGQFWAIYADCRTQHKDAVQVFEEQIDVARRLINKYSNDMKYVTTAAGLEESLSIGKIGSVLGMESGHAISSSLAILRVFYNLGIRYMTLTHSCNTPWADASEVDGGSLLARNNGLNDFGIKVVQEMNRLGMMVDLSHVSAETMADAIAASSAPVIFSHSGSRNITNHPRNVPDDILKQMRANNGIVMVNFYSCFVAAKCDATIQDVVDHINHIRKIAGIDHVGIGSDYNGVNSFPKGLEDESKYPNLFAALIEDGTWTEEDLSKLASGNLIRVFKEVEQVRDGLVMVDPDESKIPNFMRNSEESTCLSGV